MKYQKYERTWLLSLYRRMILIREFEERVKFLFLEGSMPGTIHQCQGQEAAEVGVCSALETDDVIVGTHRPHGQCIAKGMDVREMMAELFGKSTGCCAGKGGSMHMGNLRKGVVPAIAIVGGGIPIATGIGLSFKMRKEKRVAVCFMGDGATNEGTFHESLNMASIWNLPVIYAVENNLYGASTSVSMVMKVRRISERAGAYGIPGATVDGNDVIAVHEAAREAVGHARKGQGPTLLELVTYRLTGHSRRDPNLYQPEEEREKAKTRDPLLLFSKDLKEHCGIGEQELLGITEAARAEVEEALAKARQDPDPLPADALAGVFSESTR